MPRKEAGAAGGGRGQEGANPGRQQGGSCACRGSDFRELSGPEFRPCLCESPSSSAAFVCVSPLYLSLLSSLFSHLRIEINSEIFLFPIVV